jgi:hypothetical protein
VDRRGGQATPATPRKGEGPGRTAEPLRFSGWVAGATETAYAPTARTFAPAASASASFLSVRSQVKDFSVRPKWP